MSTKRTSLIEVISSAQASQLADTYHCLPGIVQAYYPDTFEADVQIALNDPRFDPDTNERIDEPWPIWPKMRVAWPRFGGIIFAGPMSAGDKVQVWWQDLEDGEYRATGQQTSPQTTRRHGSQGAFCLPYDVTDAGVATDATATGSAAVWGYDGQEGQIRLTPALIQLGRLGADFVALASKVDATLATLASAYNAHTHVAPSGGGPTGTPSSTYSPSPTGSTTVKSD